jgi:type I restriction enzyme R subunit
MNNSNFTFLSEKFPALEKLGNLAEGYLYSDPNSAIYKAGALAETVVNYMFELDNIPALDEKYNTAANRIRALKQEGLLPYEISDIVKRILYNETESIPSVTDYDLIIVDEAHRGYILDKEMSDDEQLYRSQTDYVSKYRTVIEYFDAVKIALTATPALHTTEIFGKPIFEYSYRCAVIEGFLVDHDAPHEIHTKLRDEGINYQVGETVAIYNPVTGEIINSDELEDELSFEIDSFNRKVITEPFNRTVLEEIAKDINPDGDGKTLIFAVDDNHADLIVTLLKDIQISLLVLGVIY